MLFKKKEKQDEAWKEGFIKRYDELCNETFSKSMNAINQLERVIDKQSKVIDKQADVIVMLNDRLQKLEGENENEE